MMYFHGGYNEVILFDFWRISSLCGLIGSMVGCFLLGVLYEAFKFLREYLMNDELRRSSYSTMSPGAGHISEISKSGYNTSDQHSIKRTYFADSSSIYPGVA